MPIYGFSVTVYPPLNIGLADIAIGAAFLYAPFHPSSANQFDNLPDGPIRRNLLLAGVTTAWRLDYFDESNFTINFARIAAIVLIVVLAPTFFRSIGYETMIRAVLWTLRVNIIVLLVDVVGLLPDALSPSVPWLDRPTGFFLEPGWYSGSILLLLFCLLYAETVLQRRFVNGIDIMLLVLSIIFSTGFRGITLLPFAILFLLAMDVRIRSARTLIGIAVRGHRVGGCHFFLPGFCCRQNCWASPRTGWQSCDNGHRLGRSKGHFRGAGCRTARRRGTQSR